MSLTSWQDWVAWAGIVLPLVSLAWSARGWLAIQTANKNQRAFENFYELILRIHNKDKSLISQTAAVFELRKYPLYKEFILNFCDNRQDFFDGTIHATLDAEISRTSDFYREA